MAIASIPSTWAVLAALILCLLPGCMEDGQEPSPDAVADAAVAAESAVLFSAEGELQGGAGNASPASPQGCDTLQEEGIDVAHHPWEIPAELDGTPAQVVALAVTLTVLDPTLADADLYLESPDGEVLAEDIDFDVQSGPESTVAVDGPLEPGTYVLVVRACLGAGGYELAGEATLRQVLPEAHAAGVGNATADAGA